MLKNPSRERCVVCTKTVYPTERISTEWAVFHRGCFRCQQCRTMLRLGNYSSAEKKCYCPNCFKKIFLEKGNSLKSLKSTTKIEETDKVAREELGIQHNAPVEEDEIKNTVSHLKKQIQKEKSEKEELKELLERETQMKQKYQQRVQDLEDKLKVLNAENEKLKEGGDTSLVSNPSNQQKVEEYNQLHPSLQELQSKCEEQQSKIQHLQKRNQALKKELDELDDKDEAKEYNLIDLSFYKKQLISYEKEIKSLKEQLQAKDST